VTENILPATHGAGPLLQRDYWAVLAGGALSPADVMAAVKAHFCELPPKALVRFVAGGDMAPGALLDVTIAPAQQCGVRVIHDTPLSLTLATLEGHPEAGRITFGAYRNDAGDVLFHIRSRARSGTSLTRLGFLAIGDAMQTNTWTDFIRNTAALVGASISGAVQADTLEVDEDADDDEPLCAPTFLAVGD
jgi:hypothetical protein